MIHINRDGHLPNSNWIARADGLTQQLLAASDMLARKMLIDNNEKIWGELKDFLLVISSSKCWYSESKESYSHLHVDHFRPKKAALGIDRKDCGGYWWLAFTWTNYRVCGSAGNVSKRDKFAVRQNKANDPTASTDDEAIYLLDPCEEEDVLKITFNEHGEIMPIKKAGWDRERASYTIESLNLNFKLLKEARKNVWTKCRTLILDIQNLMDLNETSFSAMRRGQIKEKLKQLKELSKPTSEFSATANTCLLSAGLEWASRIAA